MAQSHPKRISVSELVEELDIPRPFLRKILQILNKEGVLNSSKGKGGGFVLAIPPKEIGLIRLIEIFQNSVKLSDCSFKDKICADTRTCPLKKRLNGIEKQVISHLKSTTIESLLREDLSS